MERLLRILLTRRFWILALLLSALISVAGGLGGIIAGASMSLLVTVAVIGVLATWALAETRLSGKWVALILGAAGPLGLLFRVGQLWKPLGAALSSLPALGMDVWYYWMRQGSSPDMTLLVAAIADFWARLGTLLNRLGNWIARISTGRPMADLVAAALVWGLLIWLVTVWAAWFVCRRKQVLVGIFPGGVCLTVVLNYERADPTTLVVLLSAALLLMGVVRYDISLRDWMRRGVDFAEDLGLDTFVIVIPLVLGLISVAAFMPSLSARAMVEWLQNRSRPESKGVAESLGLKVKPAPTSAFETRRSPGLPNSHLLGTGPELSRKVVMYIKTGEISPRPDFALMQQPERYYWRTLTYDRYDSLGWASEAGETLSYPPGTPVLSRLPVGYRVVKQDVEAVEDLGGLMYWAGALYQADHYFEIAWRAKPNPEGERVSDWLGDPFGAMVSIGTYQAESLVPVTSLAQLRAAPAEYPGWIEQKYLALPSTVPERVLNLARDLTATIPAPYDRAKAIETYLRTLPYTLDIPAPVGIDDVTDYFLFTLKRGYCDYYATAMVVLARASGIPARLVIGFASGTYDALNARYVVTEADAHSWAEVYVPGVGWVELEPTANRPEIGRPEDISPSNLPGLPPELKIESERTIVQRLLAYAPRVLRGVVLGLGGLVLMVLAWQVGETWMLMALSPERAVRSVYRRMRRMGEQVVRDGERGGGKGSGGAKERKTEGQKPATRTPRTLVAATLRPVELKAVMLRPEAQTAYEFANALELRVANVGRPGWGAERLAEAVPEIWQITELYTRTVYSPHPPEILETRRIVRAWGKLRWRLWLARGMRKG